MVETWIGIAKRKRYIRDIVTWIAGVAIVSVALAGFFPDRFALHKVVSTTGVMEASLVLLLLVSVRMIKPVTVMIGPDRLAVVQEGVRTGALLADLVWCDPSPDDVELVLELRDELRAGPRAPIEIDLLSFTKEQRSLLLDHLSRRTGSSGSNAATPRRTPTWLRSFQQKSWRSRSSIGNRITVTGLMIVLLVTMSGYVVSSFDDGDTSGAVFAFLLTIPGLLLAIWGFRVYGSLTVSVDAAGVRLARWRRTSAIAFTDIASLTLVHTGDPEITRGHLADGPYLLIVPRSDYYVRTGTRQPNPLSKRMSLRWKIHRERFTRQEFTEMRSLIGQGVRAAGGKCFED
jgi:hypothetical protein